MYMAALRTQIYLSREQRDGLDALTARRDLSLAEAIREAVDYYLAQQLREPSAALEATFGALPDASAPARGEWAGRAQRNG